MNELDFKPGDKVLISGKYRGVILEIAVSSSATPIQFKGQTTLIPNPRQEIRYEIGSNDLNIDINEIVGASSIHYFNVPKDFALLLVCNEFSQLEHDNEAYKRFRKLRGLYGD